MNDYQENQENDDIWNIFNQIKEEKTALKTEKNNILE